jgi:type III secretion protein N (ATPase)
MAHRTWQWPIPGETVYVGSVELDAIRDRLQQASALVATGRVEAVVGLAVRASLTGARVGDVVTVRRRGPPLLAEVVGVDGGHAVLMPLGEVAGVGADDVVESRGEPLALGVSADLLGRVLDGLGEPIDGGPAICASAWVPVDRAPPPALSRRPIARPLPTGVRVIDAFATLGEGQRIGLFSGSGVGKSTLLGAIARGTAADVAVVALVGERGREVGEFVERCLGEAGRRKSVVVASTSDSPAMVRVRAAHVATAVAEYFRDQGARVLLLVDSITRFARAQREIGLAAGEPPARRGFPPSVFAALPRLLERSGQAERGSISAIYTVLVEGGDLDEPVADEARGILDGHIVLDRAIGARGRYPAVDVLRSLSRAMQAVVGEEHRVAAARLRRTMALVEAKRDLVELGAYARGSDRELDAALAAMPALEAFLSQAAGEEAPFERTVAALRSLG